MDDAEWERCKHGSKESGGGCWGGSVAVAVVRLAAGGGSWVCVKEHLVWKERAMEREAAERNGSLRTKATRHAAMAVHTEETRTVIDTAQL